MDVNIINENENGFRITTNAKDTFEIWCNLMKDSEGNCIRGKNDYSTRQGVTQKPITSSDQESICGLHSYINVTNWFVKVLARLNCSYLVWIEKQNCYGDHIRSGFDRVTTLLEEKTGLTLGQVGGPLDKTGGSTTANKGRRFFQRKNLKYILMCVNEKYHDDVSLLHKNLSCIMRIISSTQPVNTYSFNALVKKTSLHIANKFDWVQINFTLHGVLHHSNELIQKNNNTGLGELSEEALEANNKYVRRYLELYSRKNSPINQLTDVMNRLLERSHPKIVDNKYTMRPTVFCNTCGSKKHSTKRHDKAVAYDDYDLTVHDILLDISSFE